MDKIQLPIEGDGVVEAPSPLEDVVVVAASCSSEGEPWTGSISGWSDINWSVVLKDGFFSPVFLALTTVGES
jgi:hypothetical protein